MWTWGPAAILSLIGLWLWMGEQGRRKAAEIRLLFAEKLNEKIPFLEAGLKEKEEECHALLTDFKIAEEKLAMLQGAEEQLKNAFKALSSEALEKNNRSFLDLAKTSLEKFQEGAKGDLDKRQTAIKELLNPMNESLQKLDQGMRQIEKERRGDQESSKSKSSLYSKTRKC